MKSSLYFNSTQYNTKSIEFTIRVVFKNSKTNSKKYFIYEIYKIIFLHSFHPIHNRKIPSWNFSMETSITEVLDGNYVEK